MAYGDRHTSKPKRCPKCRGQKIVAVPETISGLKPWRCPKCGALGYDGRVIGDPMPFEVKVTGVKKRSIGDRYQAMKPKPLVF